MVVNKHIFNSFIVNDCINSILLRRQTVIWTKLLWHYLLGFYYWFGTDEAACTNLSLPWVFDGQTEPNTCCRHVLTQNNTDKKKKKITRVASARRNCYLLKYPGEKCSVHECFMLFMAKSISYTWVVKDVHWLPEKQLLPQDPDSVLLTVTEVSGGYHVLFSEVDCFKRSS